MPDVFNESLRSWQNFYFMAGGASATLMGLMFVALSLGTSLASETTIEGFHAFVTPSIIYFVSTLLLACIMLVPVLTPQPVALILFVGGLLGLAITSRYVSKLIQAARKHQDFTLADWLLQIILPLASYILILGGGAGFVVGKWSPAFFGLWIATISLLICAIANTWSLVIWIVEHRNS